MDYLVQLAASPTAWVALATLIVMEIVLGIDNLIFISILTNKLPVQHRAKARRIGISMALVLRLGLLSTIAFIVQLTEPVIEILGNAFSWKDMILIAGGLFLLWKATTEIHHSMDPEPEKVGSNSPSVSLGSSAFATRAPTRVTRRPPSPGRTPRSTCSRGTSTCPCSRAATGS